MNPPNNEPLNYWAGPDAGPPPRWWLYHRYITERRPVEDIAAEIGRSVSGLHVMLRRHNIPTRGAHDRQQWRDRLTREWCLEMLNAGMSMAAMARHVGCGEKTIMRALHRHRLVAPQVGPTAEMVRAMYEAGRSIPQVAHSLGLRHETVRDIMRRADIAPRRPGRRRLEAAS